MSDHHELDPTMTIAVVGMAGRFPGAPSIGDFWQKLRDGVELITFFDDDEIGSEGLGMPRPEGPGYVGAAGIVPEEDLFDAAFFDFNPREAEITDPQQRLLLEAAWEALENANCDPDRFDGSIAVFAGVGMNQYFLNNVLAHPEVFRTMAALQIQIGTDKDYVASRISYKLDLKGPSFTVQSACSTSLVAVHLACQSLQDFQSDLALAGGSTLRVPQRVGYVYQEGGIFSPDGHCRPFDAKAAGTVGGSGAAAVALKRLEDAEADGDEILALIRGSAVNNDGRAKVGYTAPSVEGQVAVISEALSASRVDPATIDYVETHGTGTTLGDPIEVTALARAYDGDTRRGSAPGEACALGSVKSNIGHLDTAAGVAGLIKTVEALRHRQLPPSLHYESPNPGIDFDETPFFVNAKLAPWPAVADRPRRAAVSAFGIGGTNAHAILEEAPDAETSGPSSRPWELLLLSARGPAALDAATEALGRHLEEHPKQSLADVAHTLRIGRRIFERRRALLVKDRDDAVEALRERDPERLLAGSGEARDRPVVFLFPGQGAQYAGMGQGLYEREATYRDVIDQGAQILEPHLGLDPRLLLHPAAGAEDPAAERLRETSLAQPALFLVEYALAKLFESWDVTPTAMIGHSIGEFVAACLAGVLSFEDALALVAARGRLMQSVPPGAMLSVPLAEEDVRKRLENHPELSLAASNGPSFQVVSGPAEGIDALAKELEGDPSLGESEARRLHTSHAFHSAMMDTVLDDFRAEVAKVALQAPEIPFLSNTTGTWITAEEATSPEYWVGQLRGAVRFGDGLAEIFRDPARVLLEVGPGRTLSSLARRHPERPRGLSILQSLRHPEDAGDDQADILTALARLWLAGASIDWEGYVAGESRRRVRLPAYPLDRKRFWLEARPRVLMGSGQLAEGTAEGEVAEVPETSTAVPAVSATYERPDLPTEYVAPRTPTEERLAELWTEALAVGGIGAIDDFFELGGHSLMATTIASRVRQVFGVDVSLNDLFEKPTVGAMAEVIDGAKERGETLEVEALPRIAPDPANKNEPFPLTDVQQAYWIGRNAGFELGGVATHVYTELPVRGVDIECVTRAWQRLIDRHDMLRAIVRDDGQQQILEEVPPFEIPVLDLRGLEREEARTRLAEVRRTMSTQVLPADVWPLFELKASRVGDDAYHIHISFDMLIGDAWSWEILVGEFRHLYRQPEAKFKPIEVSFRDYILAAKEIESGPSFERDLKYWRARLPDFPTAPELPLAMQPAAIGKPEFVRYATYLERPLWKRLKERATAAGLTHSGILLAAFGEVLTAWSKTPRFAINLTLFNRLPLHDQVNALIGDFTSLTLLEVDNREEGGFLDRAQDLQRQLWEDLDHRLVSAVRVLREIARLTQSPARAMMPVVFTSTLNMTPEDAEHGPETAPEGPAEGDPHGISQTPQVWIDHQVTENGGALFYNWDVVEKLFPKGLIGEMFEAYTQLLRRLAEDDAAWSDPAPFVLPAKQIALFAAANATQAELPIDYLHRPFWQRVGEQSGEPAVISDARSLTYDELARRAHGLAVDLREKGVEPNRLVGVVMEKGWEQIAAVLAVVEAGGAYLPIDAALPDARRDYLIENGEVEIVLTQGHLAEKLAWPEGVEVIAVDRHEPFAGDLQPLAPVQRLEDLAYVIFTSGSTGQPKGVMIDHRGAANTIADINRRFSVGPSDRVLAVSSLSFDLSVWDIFGILGAGGTVVLPPTSDGPDPAAWSRQMREQGVTIWNSVPALMELVVDEADGDSAKLAPTLRLVMMSGDWIPVALPDRLRTLSKDLEITSLGGATEGSIWSILYPISEVESEWSSIPYGQAMWNQSFHVLDHRLEARPVWVPGELYIGGVGVAKGYWGDPEKTASRFVVHPETGERLYKTGDLGRFLPDGNIQFLGREDFQVKIRGYRIELGEIEAALDLHPGIRESVTIATPSPQGEKRLVAYLIPTSDSVDEAPTADDLREHLRERLPEYMVPAFFLPLETWPLTPNGKLDRKALPSPEADTAGTKREYVAPETETEELLVTICSELLGVEKLGVHDDFFELGGDSLMATRLIFQIRKEYEVDLPVRAFFEAPTVAELGVMVEEKILEELEGLEDEELEENEATD